MRTLCSGDGGNVFGQLGPWIRQVHTVPLTPHLPQWAQVAVPGESGSVVHWAIPGGPPSLETLFQFGVQQLYGFFVLNPFMLKIVAVSFIPCNLILSHPEVGNQSCHRQQTLGD